MKRKLVLFIILFAIFSILAIGLAIYMYNKPHRNIESESADFILAANELVDEFISDENSSNKKYLDKVIIIEGEILEKETKNNGSVVFYFIDNYEGLSAHFDSVYVANNIAVIMDLSTGSIITIKGKCDGFLMLQGVVLNKCVIEE